MVEIKITDPNVSDAPTLRAILAAIEGSFYSTSITRAVGDMPVTRTTTGIIAPEDNPSAGTTIGKMFDSVLGGIALRTDDGNVETDLPDFAAARSASPNVPPVPSIAGAAPSSIVPGAPSATLTLPPVPQTNAAPPVNVAPTVAPPGPAAPQGGPVPVDSKGLPWDARIHAKSDKGGGVKNTDGSWRAKRGVSPMVTAQVEAELQQVMQIPLAAPAPLPNVPPVPTPTPQASPATTTVTAVSSFAQLLPLITGAVNSGRLTQEHVQAAVSSVGLPNLPTLATRPDLVPQVHAYLFPVA